jgi:hypothetical protein
MAVMSTLMDSQGGQRIHTHIRPASASPRDRLAVCSDHLSEHRTAPDLFSALVPSFKVEVSPSSRGQHPTRTPRTQCLLLLSLLSPAFLLLLPKLVPPRPLGPLPLPGKPLLVKPMLPSTTPPSPKPSPSPARLGPPSTSPGPARLKPLQPPFREM